MDHLDFPDQTLANEDWEYQELDDHHSGECTCHDELSLTLAVAGMGSLRAVAEELHSFADELVGLAAEGWELEKPITEDEPVRLVRR